MLTTVLSLIIGAALFALLLFLFSRQGRIEEEERNPHLKMLKKIKTHGDPAIVSLFENAKTDAERAELAAFIDRELAEQNPEDEPAAAPEGDPQSSRKSRRGLFGRKRQQQEDSLTEDIALPEPDATLPELDQQTNEIAFTTEIPAAEPQQPAAKEDELALGDILGAPAYNFWREPAVIDQQHTDAAAVDQQPVDQPEQPLYAEPAAESADNEADADEQEELAAAEFRDITETIIIDAADIAGQAALADRQEPAEAAKADQLISTAETIAAAADAEALCSLCGNPFEPGDDFCLICGNALRSEADTADTATPQGEEDLISQEIGGAELQEQPAEIEQAAVKKPRFRLFRRKKEQQAADSSQPIDSPAVTTCASCGNAISANDAFCTICGSKVGSQAAESKEAGSDFWSQAPARQEPQPAIADYQLPGSSTVGEAAAATAPRAEKEADAEALTAYQASIAAARAAAQARGVWPGWEQDSATEPVQPVEPAQPAAAQAPAAEPVQPTADQAAASDEKPANPFAIPEDLVSGEVTENTISLQDILQNVKALEERIFAEAKRPPEQRQDKE